MAGQSAGRETLDPTAWEALVQRKGEPVKAYTAFLDYVRLGAGRSLKTLLVHYRAEYRGQVEGEMGAETPPTRRLATLETWSSKHQWQARLQAYINERAHRDQVLWEERRRALQEVSWQRGGELLGLADRILAHAPLFDGKKRRVRGQKGEPDTIVESLALKADTALKAVELAIKLQREAANVPAVVRMEHTGEHGGPIQTSGVVIYLPDNGRQAAPDVPDTPEGVPGEDLPV